MLATIIILGIVAVAAGCVVHRLVAARRSGWIKIIDADGEHHRIQLPPHSVRGEDITKTNEYFTTATMAEMKDYIYRSLPDAGWAYGDSSRESLGIFLVFHRGDKRLHILIETDLDILRGRPLRTKLTITIAVNVKPSPIEQELTAIRRLGKAGNMDSVEPLIALLSDQRAKIRREVISALTIIHDERSLQPLINMLKDDDMRVRQLAAFALGKFGSKQALEALIVVLNSNDYDIDYDLQTTCAWSLGKIKDNRAVTALIVALDSPYWRLKIHAAMALGEIGDRSSVESLIACMKDTKNDAKVRAIAYLSLKKLLNATEISAMLQEMSIQSGQKSFEDHLKNRSAENVAELGTDIIFDLLGMDH
jgi:HEAT repeat protein